MFYGDGHDIINRGTDVSIFDEAKVHADIRQATETTEAVSMFAAHSKSSGYRVLLMVGLNVEIDSNI